MSNIAQATRSRTRPDPGTTSVYEPRDRAPVRMAPQVSFAAIDADLLEVLASPRQPGESHAEAFARKEHAIGSIFASMTVVEALAMEQRLRVVKVGDAVAEQFALLVVERRSRLLAFLVEIRRRGSR